MFTGAFQSPRSGKFISDTDTALRSGRVGYRCFNPLGRGNLYQINIFLQRIKNETSFNPLDRGNLYLISLYKI